MSSLAKPPDRGGEAFLACQILMYGRLALIKTGFQVEDRWAHAGFSERIF